MEELKFFGKTILIVGLGKTGKSVISYLYDKVKQIIAYDLNLDNFDYKEVNFIKFKYPNIKLISGELLKIVNNEKIDFIVLSPGVAKDDFKIIIGNDNRFKIISDIEIFLYELNRKNTKIIAITGTNGKSTVTKLCGFLCKSSDLNAFEVGNIGTPVLDILKDDKRLDVIILELSSFQLENINNLSADVAACLNISEDHLDRHKNLLNYVHIKSKIFNGAKIQVLNYDDIFCRSMAKANIKTIWISTNDNNNCEYYLKIHKHKNDIDLHHLNKKLLSMSKMSIFGVHNAFNILTALALCDGIGLDINKLIDALPKFKGLPHRIEKIDTINNITFIDDSKGTNVDATCAAILGINEPIILIAGGCAKEQNFYKLSQLIIKKVKSVFLIGKDAVEIADSLLELNFSNFKICSSLEEATLKAFNCAKEGDIILLSPACASYDMFKDYEHRSEVFYEAINKIKLLNV